MGEPGARNVSVEGRLRDIEAHLTRLEELIDRGQVSEKQALREIKQIIQSTANVVAWRKGRKDDE